MSDRVDILTVGLGSRSYDIVVGDNLLVKGSDVVSRAREICGNRPSWIITDETVADRHLQRTLAALESGGVVPTQIILPSGESTKSLDTIAAVVNTVLDGTPERASSLFALGGGVVGDIAGFAASMILRGINLIQLPTTLLSQVDSSVGGKTGVNTRHGKNLVGAFYQPSLTVADADMMTTLSRRERLAGYAEVVKYGLIGDPGFFSWLEANGPCVVDGNVDAWRHAVYTSCAAKAAVVESDERESGDRALLNFGHTFGHALEAEIGYGDELVHGEAVAIGMIMALELSAALGLCPFADVERVRRHFVGIGLPTGLPKSRAWNSEALINHMRHDKKVRDGRVTFVLSRGIGKAFVASNIDLRDVVPVLENAAISRPPIF